MCPADKSGISFWLFIHVTWPRPSLPIEPIERAHVFTASKMDAGHLYQMKALYMFRRYLSSRQISVSPRIFLFAFWTYLGRWSTLCVIFVQLDIFDFVFYQFSFTGSQCKYSRCNLVLSCLQFRLNPVSILSRTGTRFNGITPRF